MSKEFPDHSQQILDEASRLLSDHFQKSVLFTKVTQLSEPDRRNLILRLEISNPSELIPNAVILKKVAIEKGIFDGEDSQGETEQQQLSRFAHDWAGIEFLTKIGGHHAPLFYAGSIEHQFILIEDLGAIHHSLVGPLTRQHTIENVKEAENALEAYVRRLGKMHADSAGKYEIFTSLLKQIYPDALRYHFILEEDINKLPNFLKKLSISTSHELENEIREVNAFTQLNSNFRVLLHGDICPDNVYYHENSIQFIDFEFSDFGNALVDGTYLRMFMPSCWCSKTFPDDIILKMEAIYREELSKKIPEAKNEDIYKKQLIYACAYWLIRNLQGLEEIKLIDKEWICPSGPVDSDSKWDPEKNAFRPRVISRLEAFIACVGDSNYLPHLKLASILLLVHLRKIWPEVKNMDLYPVYYPKILSR